MPRPISAAPEIGLGTTPRSGQPGDHAFMALALLALLLFSPVALIVALVAVFVVIRQVRWHWWVPALIGAGATAAVVGLLWWTTGSVFGTHFAGLLAWIDGQHVPWLAV